MTDMDELVVLNIKFGVGVYKKFFFLETQKFASKECEESLVPH